MDLTVIFLFTTGIVMIAAGDTEETTVADIKAKLNKTNIEDNELDTDDDIESEERPTYWHRWFRYRRPVDLQIRVPFFQMYLRRQEKGPTKLGLQVFPDSQDVGLVNINHQWWGKKK